MAKELRTYHSTAMTGNPLDPIWGCFADLLSGVIEPGTRVRVWDQEEGTYVTGVAEFFGRNASFKEDG